MQTDSDVSVSPSQSGHDTWRGDDVIQEESVIPIQTNSGTHEQVNKRQYGRPDPLESPNRYSCLDCSTVFSLLKADRNYRPKDWPYWCVYCTVTDFLLSMQLQSCVHLSK